MLPFTLDKSVDFRWHSGDCIYIPGIRKAVENGTEEIPGKIISGEEVTDITLTLKGLTGEEKQIILDGCLMNWYAAGGGK